ncbi:hypothetical protein [Vallitalea sediminicola]
MKYNIYRSGKFVDQAIKDYDDVERKLLISSKDICCETESNIINLTDDLQRYYIGLSKKIGTLIEGIRSNIVSNINHLKRFFDKHNNIIVNNKNVNRLTEQDLRNQLVTLVKEHLHFIEENKNIGFYSTNKSIDMVLNNDNTISYVSGRLGVPKALIQAILLKEIRMYDMRDAVADSFVMENYRFEDEIERYQQLTWVQKLLIGPPKVNGPMRKDSSTGLGQIFARTAIASHNWGIDKDYVEGEKLDYDDWHDSKNMWYQLQDSKTNIFYVGLVLKYKASLLGIDLDTATNEQLQQLLARYNGFGDAAAEYGRETKEYCDLFSKFNK